MNAYAVMSKRELCEAANAAVARIAPAGEPVGKFSPRDYLLLSVEADAKTVKGSKVGYLTGVLYLLASGDSGVINVCPWSDGCEAPCLVRSGKGGLNPRAFARGAVVTNPVLAARMRKTLLFKADRALFLEMFARDVEQLEREADRRGMVPAVRTNGTSDLPYEKFPVRGASSIMDAFPHVTFYDYTKWPLRLRGRRGELPANYSLTFSLAITNDESARAALEAGVNVAVVFDTRKGQELPPAFELAGIRARVVDGDESDLRFLDERGVIVGLRAKGPAIGDTSGFVRRAVNAF